MDAVLIVVKVLSHLNVSHSKVSMVTTKATMATALLVRRRKEKHRIRNHKTPHPTVAATACTLSATMRTRPKGHQDDHKKWHGTI